MLPEKLELAIDPSYELADGSRVTRATYSESSSPELLGYSVVAIADTILPELPLAFLNREATQKRAQALNPQRITTIVARFPRCILAELNTHRVFSRNSASSRARSIKVVIADVMEDPYVPIFTKNQRGMSGPIVSQEAQAAARIEWLKARDATVAGVLSMLLGTTVTSEEIQNDGWRALTDDYYQRVYLDEQEIPGSLNLHKQNINRLMEPFMWHEAVITATEWENFLQLRDHDDADPAIHGLGKLVGAVLQLSKPVESTIHAPFAGELIRNLEEDRSMLNPKELFGRAIAAANYSSGAAAQVSYRPVADGGTGANPAKLADRLLIMTHLSPFEHAAFSTEWLSSLGIGAVPKSNFSEHWTQHRSLVSYLQSATGKSDLGSLLEALL